MDSPTYTTKKKGIKIMENNENNQNVVTDTTSTNQEINEVEKKSGEEVKEEKTFTQKELDEIVEKRLAKVKKNMPSKEELQKYNNWLESQKTEEQKAQEKEKEFQKIILEKDNLQKENLLLRKNVKIDDVDYVLFKVSKQEGNFEDNLEQFLTDNPKYLSSYEEQHKTVDFGVEHTEKEVDGYEQARKIMGLK
jgi:hypothetical protein